MRYRERQYVIDHETLQDPDVSELASRAKGAVDLWSVEYDELVNEFLGSQRFRGLTETERFMSVRAVKACVDGAEWALGSELDETGLFAVDVPTERIKTTEDDAMVLSGALGLLVEECYVDNKSGSIWDGLGRDGNLEDLKLLGALMSLGGSPTGAGAGFELSDSGQKKSMVYVGADFHGDFGMWQVDSSHTSAYSPGGIKEPFSPTEIKGVRAYHSVEIDMVKSALGHLASDYTGEKLVSFIDEILIKMKQPLRPGSRAFGDYGSHDRTVRRAAEEWRLEPEVGVRQHGLLDIFMVTPSNHDAKLAIFSEENGIRFRQLEEGDLGSSSSDIYIPDEHIGDLIAAIATSDQGRVAPQEIIGLLQLIRESAMKPSDA